MEGKWVFTQAAADGTSSGPSAAGFAFGKSLDDFARETLQNSKDAKPKSDNESGPVSVVYRLITLEGEPLEEFKRGMKWNELEDNLRAWPEKRTGGETIHKAIDKLEKEKKLQIMVIEDSGTTGLTGNERRADENEKNCFCALTKDCLLSDKASDTAGGSYGLGSSMLYEFSSFRTVLFASKLTEYPDGKSGIRLYGTADLHSHKTEQDGECSGVGHFGIQHKSSLGRYAESLWAGDDDDLEGIFCARSDIGTSIVIVGFCPPIGEDKDPEVIIKQIKERVLESYWPILTKNEIKVTVKYEIYGGDGQGNTLFDKELDPNTEPSTSKLVSLYSKYNNGELQEIDNLNEQHSSCLKKIKIKIPERIATEKPHNEFKGEVKLLVQLIKDDDVNDEIKDKIYQFRGPGIIVRGTKRQNMSLNARPFIAILLCGQASGDTEADQKVEQFLSCAEPPAHDDWVPTEKVKENYKEYGIVKIFNDIDKAVKTAVRDLVSLPEEKGGGLPKRFMKFLRFGKSKSGGGNELYVSFTRPLTQIENGAVEFRINCKRIKRDEEQTEDIQKGWEVSIQLKFTKDGGGSDLVRAIEDVSCANGKPRIEDGIGYIDFAPDVDSGTITVKTNKNKYPVPIANTKYLFNYGATPIEEGES